MKRFFDIVFSVLALVVLSPLFFFLAGFIKLCSPGPVFFRQIRVGKDGRGFEVLKFRTMHTGGFAQNLNTTLRDDTRLFHGGATIRRYKLDELPQIINVLTGDMSLVGPRPTVREDYERMTEDQRRRVSVRPGLTGLAQVNGNTSLSWPQRIELDLAYIDQSSLLDDLIIIAKTIGQIATGKADTHPASGDEWR